MVLGMKGGGFGFAVLPRLIVLFVRVDATLRMLFVVCRRIDIDVSEVVSHQIILALDRCGSTMFYNHQFLFQTTILLLDC